jgi:hypothetical protein
MVDLQSWWQRPALLTALVEKAPGQTLAHTTLVAMVYFLQAIRRVPLGYQFRLHLSGPSDEKVLDDLAYAQSLQAVQSHLVLYEGGYHYDIRPGPQAEAIKGHAQDWLARYQEEIDWVVQEFAGYTTAGLVLAGIIVYADREMGQLHQAGSARILAQRARGLKPRLDLDYIIQKVEALEQKGFLLSTPVHA